MLDTVKSRYIWGCFVSNIIFMHSSVSFKVYERLQKLNLTMSHVVTNRLLASFGVNHDVRVKEWCDEFAACLKQEHTAVGYSGVHCVNI